ncbi:MAG: DMT family transporter [Clostridiales Family XIII bacterium]|jgi:drug/metabolite transporter (DMT)-like permease|nr:DMT family transporter [Clostridiales Family XIII bacterium]
MHSHWWESKRSGYLLMIMLVFFWGFEYIVAKSALDACKPITLVFFKYSVGFVVLTVIKLARDRRLPFRKKDIPFFLICAIFGDIFYYGCEYGALTYLPVSVVTIILAFVPAVSIVAEIFVYKRKPTVAIVAGIVVCAAGVGLVVGADFTELLKGGAIGYLLAFFAVISWNIYNFITAKLTGHYNPLDLTLYQLAAAILLSAPYAAFNLPDVALADPSLILAIAYLGVVSSAFGFMIYVNAVAVIGVTPSSLFSNMLPVTSTFFGWIFLRETISFAQIMGGVIVIAAGSVVIWLKGKQDEIEP